jgi:hypothetical protein
MRNGMTLCAAITTVFLLASAGASAETMFSATLTGDQEVPPVVTNAGGTAMLTLNDDQNSLSYTLQLFGVDLDGNQTPDDSSDDVTGLHIHAAPAGVNGGVVFGMISPGHDLDDLMIDAVAGTVSGAWELTDDNGNASLSDNLDELFSEGLYFNVHTPANPGGEIRGQIVPEPGTLAFLALGAARVLRRRR